MHTHSPEKLKKFKQTLPVYQKLMTAVFWNRKGVLMVKFVEKGTTIATQVYCNTPKNYVGPFRTKGMEC
jgi:hypothetical protein